jgi:hypothetical protein
MAIFSYVLVRDYGFAPNPFYAVCTLATCKPLIRSKACVDDWVLGFGSYDDRAVTGKLIYAMKVEKKCTFDEYWNSPEFSRKKPVMNGSLKQKYGDNIYHHGINGEWVQEDSHHKNANGTVNEHNLKRDTKKDYVLISRQYWYWGKYAIPILDTLKDLVKKGRNHKEISSLTLEDELEKWLYSFKIKGYIGRPAKFLGKFERYNDSSL